MKGRLNTWLLLVVIICAVSLYFGKDLVLPGKDDAADTLRRPVAEVDYDLPAGEATIHLVILNGTGEPGLAREVGLLLGQAGCVAESIGNAPHRNFKRSLLINRRLSDRQAARLAGRLGGIRVIREGDGRVGEDAVLVLGADYTALISSLAGAAESGGV